MTRPTLIASLIAGTALAANPVSAQESSPAELQTQIAELKAEIQRLSNQISAIEAEQRKQAASSAQAEQVAASAMTTADAALTAAGQATQASSETAIEWKGAPKFTAPGGWSIKPRGRIQVDAGFVAAPDSTGRTDGYGSELRRARLGVEGDIPGGFGYKFEVDFAGNVTEVVDAILTYQDDGITVAAGQHNTFQSLEELTSSRFSSFIERAAFTDAFAFERRLGLSGTYAGKDVLVQAGVFSDNIGTSIVGGKNYSLDGRLVYLPRLGDTQLHLGGSLHYAELKDDRSVRYRQRPLVHFTPERFINTGLFSAEKEFGVGAEAAVINGRFHAAGEAFWQNVDRPEGYADPAFFGGYVEAGLFLTDDTRGYKGGIFDRVKPNNPVDEGGVGAFQINLRYDYLDLVDEDIIGGIQNGYFASLIWTPTDYTRLMLNYGHLSYDQAVHPAVGSDQSYGVDTVAVRGQIDF